MSHTRTRFTRIATATAAATLAITALAGCSSDGGDAGTTTLTFRTWDENAAAAYQESFDAFTKENPDITVTIDIIPWADYFTKLRTDIAGGSAADLFWINNSSYSGYASSGALLSIDDLYGADADSAKEGWAPAVVDQFTQDDTLWGIPQTSDGGIGIYYNKDLLEAAGLTPDDLQNLTWSPDGTDDTLLSTAQKLTIDSAGKTADEDGFNGDDIAQYGYNAAQDLQAIYLPFIGSNGGTYQDGDEFTFTNPKTEEAFQYLVDLINTYHVSPSAADTNENGNFSLDAFTQGKLALFQSGLYNLANIADTVDFDWGVAPLPAGPAGAVSVTNGIAVVGNAKSEHADATAKLLKWLGSEEGNSYIGAEGANLPGVLAAQQVYLDYWTGKDVDVQPFFDVIDGAETIPAPVGENFNAAYAAYTPILSQVFLGQLSVEDGLQQADDAANAAVNGG
ncbi:MAG: sugar ABC transporter substrate-binding protein [Microbacterium sp.]